MLSRHCTPEKSILKFKSLSNIHVFKFALGCLFSYHTAFNTQGSLRQPNFQNFLGQQSAEIPKPSARPLTYYDRYNPSPITALVNISLAVEVWMLTSLNVSGAPEGYEQIT